SSTNGAGTGCANPTYQTTPGALTPRNDAAAAFGSDGLAYIAGGAPAGAIPLNLVEVLNPDSGVVTLGPPMLSPHAAFALVASPDRRSLYAIGGYDLVGSTADVERFDVPAQQWTSMPPLPIAGGQTFAGVLDDGRIVVVLPEVPGIDGGAALEIWDSDAGWVIGPD